MAACAVCFDAYNEDSRLPLLAPCGHTLCKECVSPLQACPFCRAPLPPGRNLPRNYALLEVLEAERSEGVEEQLLRKHGLLPASGLPVGPIIPADDLQLTTTELGSGGAGRVVLGYLRGREVAVKLLPLSGPPAAREALQREVTLLARVSSSCRHTVKLLGVSVKDGRLALVMRRYPASLAQNLERQEGGSLPPGRVLLLAHDLLRGLAELHAHGVVMADMKPDNVLVDEAGVPLLCDFGIGRALSATIGPHANIASPAGSIHYMAPEQFAVDKSDVVTPQSDMWGLAATLLHLLTGRPPWAALNIGQITMQVGVHRRAPELPALLHPALRRLLRSCLRPDPHTRPSAAGALALLGRELEERLALGAEEAEEGAEGEVEAAVAEAGAQAPSQQRPSQQAAQPASQAQRQPQRQPQQRQPEEELGSASMALPHRAPAAEPPSQLQQQRQQPPQQRQQHHHQQPPDEEPFVAFSGLVIAEWPPTHERPDPEAQNGSAQGTLTQGQTGRRQHGGRGGRGGRGRGRHEPPAPQHRPEAQQPRWEPGRRPAIPVQIVLADTPSMRVSGVAAPTWRLPAVRSEEEGGRVKVYARPTQGGLHAAADALPVPRAHRRYLVRTLDSRGRPAGFKDLGDGAIFQDPGMYLMSFLEEGEVEAQARLIVVLDTRVPKPRVMVWLLSPPNGAVCVPGLEVDPETSSRHLGLRAALTAMAESPGHVSTQGKFELLVDGLRRSVPALLGSGELRDGSTVYMMGRDPVEDLRIRVNVERSVERRILHLKCNATTLVCELKEQVKAKTGIEPDDQCLCLGDLELEDGYSVGKYSIRDGSVLGLRSLDDAGT